MDDIRVRLFVSSPADVRPERDRVSLVAERLSGAFEGVARIEALRWEDGFYSATKSFQEQIHDAVWGDAQTVESGLVEVYAGKVRRKLQAARASVLIETCRGIGYRLISGEAAAL